MITDKQNIILAILTGTAFVLLFGFFTFLVILNFVKRKRKFVIERQIRESEFQQEILQAQLEMQEHTFKTVSQEIHDNVGQLLSLVKINLNILTLDENAPERLIDVKDQVTNAITELRHLSTGYYADKLADRGLLAGIENQLHQLQKTGLFTVSFETTVDMISMDKNKTIFLYRMVQEVLNNVVKHSEADTVSANVFEDGDGIHIVIQDNGKGFSTEEAGFEAGIGLTSIRQRAAMIDAVVDINSQKDQGTTVHLICKPG